MFPIWIRSSTAGPSPRATLPLRRHRPPGRAACKGHAQPSGFRGGIPTYLRTRRTCSRSGRNLDPLSSRPSHGPRRTAHGREAGRAGALRSAKYSLGARDLCPRGISTGTRFIQFNWIGGGRGARPPAAAAAAVAGTYAHTLPHGTAYAWFDATPVASLARPSPGDN